MTITYEEPFQDLNVRFGRGRMTKTIEIESLALVDLDDAGRALER